MRIDVPINSADVVVLVVLAVLFVAGIRIVIGFFRTPKHKDTVDRTDEENRKEDERW